MHFLQGVHFQFQHLLKKSLLLCKKKYHYLKEFQFNCTERQLQCRLHFLQSLQSHLHMFEWTLFVPMVQQYQFDMTQIFLSVEFPRQLVSFLHQFEQHHQLVGVQSNNLIFFLLFFSFELASCTKRLLVRHSQLKFFSQIYQAIHSEEKKKNVYCHKIDIQFQQINEVNTMVEKYYLS